MIHKYKRFHKQVWPTFVDLNWLWRHINISVSSPFPPVLFLFSSTFTKRFGGGNRPSRLAEVEFSMGLAGTWQVIRLGLVSDYSMPSFSRSVPASWIWHLLAAKPMISTTSITWSTSATTKLSLIWWSRLAYQFFQSFCTKTENLNLLNGEETINMDRIVCDDRLNILLAKRYSQVFLR